MSVLVRNHVQTFRPLRGGIAIMNGGVRFFGTLGFVATAGGGDRWLVSAYHVLVGKDRPAVDGEGIFQPAVGGPAEPVATTDAARSDQALDVAAALVAPGVDVTPEILGLGAVAGTVDPAPGMRVVKSGIASGVTEGVVVEVEASRTVIETLAGYPSKYELSSVSDSGAAWLEQSTRRVAALHVAGNDAGTEVAIGVPVARVLAALGLQVLA